MRAFGAEVTGSIRTLPRTACLRQLRKLQQTVTFRTKLPAETGVLTALRQARRTGIRVPVPVDALDGRLARLPPGVSVGRDRIEVRVTSAKDAVAKLFALAQALTHGQEGIPVRFRDTDPPPDISLICDEEIAEAVKVVLESQFATAKDELVVKVARLLGIGSTRHNVASRLGRVIGDLANEGELVLDAADGRLHLAGSGG